MRLPWAQKTSASGINRPRNPNGRFGGSQGGHDDAGTSFLSDKIGHVGDAVRGRAQSGDGLDPAITAMGEIKTTLEPLGRGAFALLGRSEKQKKERWYSKILKALTLNKDPLQVSGGSGGDGGGVFAMLARLIGPVVAAIGPAILASLGVVGAVGLGLYIGTKIYEWLDKSGIATKIFDAFDAIGDWFTEKVKKPIGQVKADFNKGSDEVDRTKLNHEQFRRSERNTKFNEDGSITPGDPNVPLAPSHSVAQSVGRAKGHVKNFLVEKAGFSPVTAGNDPVARSKKGKPTQYGAAAERKSALIAQMDTAGITDPTERAAFLAQMDHESGGFKHMEELGKSDYFKKYDGRKDLGNTEPGDGERFKGRGFIQLTGRSNYKSMGEKLGLDLVNNPDLAKDPAVAAKVATQFWNDRSRAKRMGGGKISDLARVGDIDAVTQGINGGMNGGQARRDLFSSYLKTGTGDQKVLTTSGLSSIYATNVSSGIPLPKMPAIPSSAPTKIPPIPEISMPTPGTEKEPPISVSVSNPVGQNVSDRTIAHVASGGIGASGGW